MKRFLYELSESWKIAAAQMAANKTRSMLTALGVIIGIVAVTLMGTAINGISTGFDKSMAVIGDDVLYVSQRPWTRMNDWWNYRDRKKIRTEYAEKINHAVAATPSSNLMVAVPTMSLLRSVKARDKTHMADAREELTGIIRRLRSLPPEKREDFSINEQQAFKSTLDGVKATIAIAGLFITGLSLFVGAIGIMNITFVSVKERTREIGTRKALGARRRTILLQFLIESASLCLLGGFIGLGVAYVMCTGIGQAFPSFPIQFSLGLVLVSMAVSILTGLFSGFAPAWSASRLDPVAALRYE